MVKAIRSRARRLIWHGPLAPIAAAFDMLDPSLGDFLSEPLNGQIGRRAIIEELLELFPFTRIIETGTFRGSSTKYFGSLRKAKVISIEAVPRHHWYARIRLRGNRWVQLILGESVAVLRSLSANAEITGHPTLFYLDAHWQDELPLGDELRLIASNWPSWLAVIDDFRVPSDPQYAFDDYGHGKSLDVNYLANVELDSLRLFWPRLPAVEDTGLRRGCVVVTNNAAIARELKHESRTLSAELEGFGSFAAAGRTGARDGEWREE